MTELLSTVLLAVGVVFMFLGAVGVWSMPDLYTRMQATSKTSTMGLGCTLLAVAVHFGELGVVTRAIAVIAFAFITAPVAAQMIARAAFFMNVSMWKTPINELEGRYDHETLELRSAGRDPLPPQPEEEL